MHEIFEIIDVLVHVFTFIGFPELSKFGTINKIWFASINHLYSTKLMNSIESQWFFVDCELKKLSHQKSQPSTDKEIIHGYLHFLINKGIRLLVSQISETIYLHIKSNFVETKFLYELFDVNHYEMVGIFHQYSDEVLIIHTVKKTHPQNPQTRVDFIVDFNNFPSITTKTKTFDKVFLSSGCNHCSICDQSFIAQLTLPNGNIDQECCLVDSHILCVYDILNNGYKTFYLNNSIDRVHFFNNKYIIYSIADVCQDHKIFWEIIELDGKQNHQTRLSKSCQEFLQNGFIEEILKVDDEHFVISVLFGSTISKKSSKLFHLIKTKEKWVIKPIFSVDYRSMQPIRCPFSQKLYLIPKNQIFQKVKLCPID